MCRGPQSQLYFLGCEIEALYPLGPLFHGCGLSVTAMSLNGKLKVGVISCPDLLPDLGDWSTTSMLRSRSYLNARVRRTCEMARAFG
jgi:diacylglycerol O-acyltransferase